MSIIVNEVICGDALTVLREMPDGVIQTCITSPPFWGLRDYGVDGQLGLESTPEEYVAKMVEVFAEVRRVLRDDGTLWLNLGDSYARQGGLGRNRYFDGREEKPGLVNAVMNTAVAGLKEKDLVGIPWLVAFTLRADGWYLRSDIIWSKPNPMPESVIDRPTKAHEYIFLLSKSQKYYYDADAIRERTGTEADPDNYGGKSWHDHSRDMEAGQSQKKTMPNCTHPAGRNKRSVWTVATQPFPGCHFATFPEKLIEPCILAGTSDRGQCPECGKPWVRSVEKERAPRRTTDSIAAKQANDHPQGNFSTVRWDEPDITKTLGWRPQCKCGAEPVPQIILDPFFGSGTVGKRAKELGRRWIGIDLSPEYCEMARLQCCQEELF